MHDGWPAEWLFFAGCADSGRGLSLNPITCGHRAYGDAGIVWSVTSCSTVRIGMRDCLKSTLHYYLLVDIACRRCFPPFGFPNIRRPWGGQ